MARFADPAAAMGGSAARFAAPAAEGLFGTAAWYDVVRQHALPAGSRAVFDVWSDAAGPAAVFPLLLRPDGRQQALTTPYTCLYAPILAAGLPDDAVRAAGRAFAERCRRAASVRLDALDAAAPYLAPLLDGVRAAGLLVRRFEHFGNWHQPVDGLSWRGYLEARPGALRETVRRKLGRIERDPAAHIDVVDGPEGLAPAIAAFEDVYARSWKEPEPFPEFNAALMRRIAPLGVLRLGLLRVGGVPVAAQVWVVEQGRATVLKLAHDEAHKAISPGTALTAFMLRRLIGEERVAEIDFGRGDDPYKRQWAAERRQRIGVLLVNPLHPGGLAVLGRQALGGARRALRSLARPAASPAGRP